MNGRLAVLGLVGTDVFFYSPVPIGDGVGDGIVLNVGTEVNGICVLVVVSHDRHGSAFTELEVQLFLGIAEVLAANEGTGACMDNVCRSGGHVEGFLKDGIQVETDLHVASFCYGNQVLIEYPHLDRKSVV